MVSREMILDVALLSVFASQSYFVACSDNNFYSPVVTL